MALNRRQLLVMAAAAASVPITRALPALAGDANLNAVLDAFADEKLNRFPEQATVLGLDKDGRRSAKSRLDERSLAARQRDKSANLDRLRRLGSIDRSALTGLDAVNYDTVAYIMRTQAEIDRFDYGDLNGPYVVSQLSGAYQWIPDFLDSQHSIETKADADAYLARLEAFAVVLDQEIEMVRHDAERGVIPPDFAMAKMAVQLSELRRQSAEKTVLVQSLARRTREKGIEGDHAQQAAKLYDGKVVPALDRQIALTAELKPRAVHDAGVWRLPDGGAYYAAWLKRQTTTTLSPEELHKTGREL